MARQVGNLAHNHWFPLRVWDQLFIAMICVWRSERFVASCKVSLLPKAKQKIAKEMRCDTHTCDGAYEAI